MKTLVFVGIMVATIVVPAVVLLVAKVIVSRMRD